MRATTAQWAWHQVVLAVLHPLILLALVGTVWATNYGHLSIPGASWYLWGIITPIYASTTVAIIKKLAATAAARRHD